MVVSNEDYRSIEIEWLLLMKEAKNIGISHQEVHTFLTENSIQSINDNKLNQIKNRN